MARRFSVEAIFSAVDRTTAPINRIQNRLLRFITRTRAAFMTLESGINAVQDRIKKYGTVAVGALTAVGAAVARVLGFGAEFEQTLVNAAVKFPGEIRKGSDAFKLLEKTARDVGATTEFTASQAASGLNFLAMAGFDASQAMASLPGLVNLATAAQVELGEASDIATDSLGAFNLLTKDAMQLQKNLTRVSDVLALTTVRANTNMADMFEAIKDGAPVATAAGASVETVAAMIGVMANAGIKGTRAGTALKNIFLAVSAPGSEAAKVMRHLGVRTRDASGNIRDAVDIFQDFSDATKKLGDAKRIAVFNAIFGKIPIAAAINLTNAVDTMRDLRTELEGATGASAKMASTMRDTNLGRWKTLLSVIESIQISIFSVNAGPLADALDRITENLRGKGPEIADKLGKAIIYILDNFEDLVSKAATIFKFVAAIWVLNFAVSTVVVTTTSVILAYKAWGKILLAIPKIMAFVRASVLALNLIFAASPIGWVVLGITALIAVGTLLVSKWSSVKNFFKNLWGFFLDTIERVKPAFESIGSFLGAVFSPITAVIEYIQQKYDQIKNGPIGRFFSDVSSFFTGDEGTPEEPVAANAGQYVISPQDRTAAQIKETVETSKAEVVIRDETTRAEITSGALGSGITLQQSGGF